MSKEDSHRDHVIDGILMSDHPKISKAVRRLRRVKAAVATGEVDCPWKRIEQERSLLSAGARTTLATENALQLGERLLASDAISDVLNKKTAAPAAVTPSAAAPPAASLAEDEDEIPTRAATNAAIAAGKKSIRECQEAIVSTRLASLDRTIRVMEGAIRRVENSESIFFLFFSFLIFPFF